MSRKEHWTHLSMNGGKKSIQIFTFSDFDLLLDDFEIWENLDTLESEDFLLGFGTSCSGFESKVFKYRCITFIL